MKSKEEILDKKIRKLHNGTPYFPLGQIYEAMQEYADILKPIEILERCETCKFWRKKHLVDSITKRKYPSGLGLCEEINKSVNGFNGKVIKLRTTGDFGCNHYEYDENHHLKRYTI